MKSNDMKKPEMTTEIRDMVKNAPAFDMQDIPELRDFEQDTVVIRGFSALREHLSKSNKSVLSSVRSYRKKELEFA